MFDPTVWSPSLSCWLARLWGEGLSLESQIRRRKETKIYLFQSSQQLNRCIDKLQKKFQPQSRGHRSSGPHSDRSRLCCTRRFGTLAGGPAVHSRICRFCTLYPCHSPKPAKHDYIPDWLSYLTLSTDHGVLQAWPEAFIAGRPLPRLVAPGGGAVVPLQGRVGGKAPDPPWCQAPPGPGVPAVVVLPHLREAVPEVACGGPGQAGEPSDGRVGRALVVASFGRPVLAGGFCRVSICFYIRNILNTIFVWNMLIFRISMNIWVVWQTW